MKSLFKNPWRSHPLKGFFKGLGVVKGEGVATAKKASPFPLKKRKIFKVFKWWGDKSQFIPTKYLNCHNPIYYQLHSHHL